MRERKSYAPRLKTANASLDGLVRLRFHARGAISNLFVDPLVGVRPLGDSEVLVHVHAVGLNFRDVLNVLGEYPGDPGSPGGDSAGVVDDASNDAFGLSNAPLASVAIAHTQLLARRPDGLTFEQACTLPVTWSTTHVALERARLCSGRSIILHAAAGGVGLKAVEYAQWLLSPVVGLSLIHI